MTLRADLISLLSMAATLRSKPHTTSRRRHLDRIAPTLDAVQEVNVMTTTYDARYGRTTGGTVNIVSKNGTNEFHGELV